jgi:UDP-3-O-[3-hydroxymyristoyl] glucosamine N-acyltransferase
VKLRHLADRLGCRLEGDGEIDITRVSGIEQAGPGDLTFLANPKYAHALASTRASAVILEENAPVAPCAMLRTSEPYVAFARALSLLAAPDRPTPGVHPTSIVEVGADVAADAHVGPFVRIGRDAKVGARSVLHGFCDVGPGATIGADCVIHTHVAIRERVTLGDRVVLQNGVIVGADGFGFATTAAGTHEKIPQLGVVVIEDDVEIGANSAVDRPAVGETRIGAGTKIDNLVQVAHGVKVGRNVLLAAQVGIAGSTTIGDSVVLAGQVGVSGHIAIGDRVRASAQSGIPNSVPAGEFVSGYPAIANRDWLKSSAVFQKLPEMRKALRDLERRLAALESAGREPDSGEAEAGSR